MKKNINFAGTAFALSCLAHTALAEGLERQTFSANFLYEVGNYAELSYSQVNPNLKVTVGGVSSPNSVAKSFNTTTGKFKADIGDKFALGLLWSNGTNGVGIDYSGSGIPGVALPIANIIGSEIQMLGRYNATDQISAFGGMKMVSASGDLNLNGTQFIMGDAQGSGFILGAGYERPEIALLAIASYESAINLDLPTTAGGAAVGNTSTGIGDALQFEFQTGIAPDTLAYGKIRWSRWADNQVVVPLLGTVSSFDDGSSYEFGIARRMNAKLALFASAFYDAGDGTDASALAPIGDTQALSLGARYTFDNGVNLGLGLRATHYGAATIAAPFNAYSFTGSNVFGVGLRISKNF